jgi:hypothetical protein
MQGNFGETIPSWQRSPNGAFYSAMMRRWRVLRKPQADGRSPTPKRAGADALALPAKVNALVYQPTID